MCVCLSVCLSVCPRVNVQTVGPIVTKLGRKVEKHPESDLHWPEVTSGNRKWRHRLQIASTDQNQSLGGKPLVQSRPNRWSDRHQIWHEGRRPSGKWSALTRSDLQKPEVTPQAKNSLDWPKSSKWGANRWSDRHQIWYEGRGPSGKWSALTGSDLRKPEVTSQAKNSLNQPKSGSERQGKGMIPTKPDCTNTELMGSVMGYWRWHHKTKSDLLGQEVTS